VLDDRGYASVVQSRAIGATFVSSSGMSSFRSLARFARYRRNRDTFLQIGNRRAARADPSRANRAASQFLVVSDLPAHSFAFSFAQWAQVSVHSQRRFATARRRFPSEIPVCDLSRAAQSRLKSRPNGDNGEEDRRALARRSGCSFMFI